MIEAEEKVRVIQENLRAAQSRQKNYSDKRRKPLKFQVGDCWRLPTSPSDDARRRQFGMAVFHELRIDPQAHGIPL